ncbi:MAG: hypothetical protein AABX73_00815 [Nanoarchaeota archaeon]
MKTSFAIERTTDGISLRRSKVEKLLGVNFLEGLCSADKTSPENYSSMRSRKFYNDNIIKPLVKSGKIGDGTSDKFDDRKLRFHSAIINKGILEIRTGISYYQAHKEIVKNTKTENERLKARGLNFLEDEYAFFERPIAVAAALITNEGCVFLGERANVSTYVGSLSLAAGYISYTDELNTINPEKEARREVEEEIGVIERDIISMKFVGLYTNPDSGVVDFTYLAPIRMSNKELLSAWEKAKDKEHSRKIQIPDYSALQHLLKTGSLKKTDKKFNLMHSARGALQSIRLGEIND